MKHPPVSDSRARPFVCHESDVITLRRFAHLFLRRVHPTSGPPIFRQVTGSQCVSSFWFELHQHGTILQIPGHLSFLEPGLKLELVKLLLSTCEPM